MTADPCRYPCDCSIDLDPHCSCSDAHQAAQPDTTKCPIHERNHSLTSDDICTCRAETAQPDTTELRAVAHEEGFIAGYEQAMEDRAALLNENTTLRDALTQVSQWIDEAPDQTAGLDLLRQIVTPPPAVRAAATEETR